MLKRPLKADLSCGPRHIATDRAICWDSHRCRHTRCIRDSEVRAMPIDLSPLFVRASCRESPDAHDEPCPFPRIEIVEP